MADVALALGVLGLLVAVPTSVALCIAPRQWRVLVPLDALGVVMMLGAVLLLAAALGPGCTTFSC